MVSVIHYKIDIHVVVMYVESNELYNIKAIVVMYVDDKDNRFFSQQ